MLLTNPFARKFNVKLGRLRDGYWVSSSFSWTQNSTKRKAHHHPSTEVHQGEVEESQKVRSICALEKQELLHCLEEFSFFQTCHIHSHHPS